MRRENNELADQNVMAGGGFAAQQSGSTVRQPTGCILSRMNRFRRRMAARDAREAQRLTRIQRRFGNVHRPHNRRVAARRFGRFARASPPLFLIVFGGVFMALVLSPFPPLQSIRHIAAAPGCTASRAVGLAPAVAGAAGYWTRNDQDGDGVACEALPPAQAERGLPFASCTAARAADAAPVRWGRPGFGPHLDADGDGVGCEPHGLR